MLGKKPDHNKVFTVTELAREVKNVVEGRFPTVCVEGEISKFFTHQQSGHTYVTLKDEKSVIEGAIWKGVKNSLKYIPNVGDQVVIRGKITTFPARSQYQINIVEIEPKGLGALQAAFEKLKKKLEQEGLFKEERKRELPYIAWSVGIVTSPTGAVIRDMIRTISRRFPGIRIVLAPSAVQGDGAAEKIAEAIDDLNRYGKVDVIIAGRGGGSIEDLWAFNEEPVTRAIFRSKIPVVSAVGHETDFTIADFVADKRASTPTAAAEMIAPERLKVEERLKTAIDDLKHELSSLLQYYAQTVDDLSDRADRAIKSSVSVGVHAFEGKHRSLSALSPRVRLKHNQELLIGKRRSLFTAVKKLQEAYSFSAYSSIRSISSVGLHKLHKEKSAHFERTENRLTQAAARNVENLQSRLKAAEGRLGAVSPMAVLERGYSIVTNPSGEKVYRFADELSKGDQIKIRMSRGEVEATIGRKEKNQQERLF